MSIVRRGIILVIENQCPLEYSRVYYTVCRLLIIPSTYLYYKHGVPASLLHFSHSGGAGVTQKYGGINGLVLVTEVWTLDEKH